MNDATVIRASAFAPAHVTGVFRPSPRTRDPRARGSIGAGVVLELGVRATAEFRAGPTRRLQLTSDVPIPLPISENVARRLAPPDAGTLRVRLDHELPIGQGFGMSAAGATATALAVGTISGRSRADALRVAHLADLFGGGGLGGVAAIVGGGGVEFRTRAGLPPRGRVAHDPLPGSLLVGVVGGPLPSPRLLGDPRFLDRVTVASEGLEELLAEPGSTPFFELSQRFTDRLDLAPPALRRLIRAMRRRGAWTAQAMFGRSFFARPRGPRQHREVVRWLERSGVRAVELSAAARGAHARRRSQPL
ncbi:MAG: hypothetical protein WA719_01870 [Thermoplasmata archaeon]